MIFALTLNNSISITNVDVVSVFVIIQFTFTIYSWNKLRGTIFDAYIVFTLVFYIFNLSQPVLETTSLAVEFRRLWGEGYGISNRLYYMASYFSLASANVFYIGSLLSLDDHKNTPIRPLYNRTQYLNAFRRTSIVFCIISGPFYLYNLVQNFFIVKVMGYAGIYEMANVNRGYAIIGDMYEPAMLAFFSSCMLLKNKIRLATFFIVLTMFLPPLVIGGRANAMMVLAIIFIIVSCTSKINIRKLAVVGIVGVVMLYVMNIIATTRTDVGKSYQDIADAAKENENPVVSTIQEMGWSMYPLALTMEVVPDKKDYAYGSSFFWAGISLVPNIGLWNGEHPGKKNDPAEWLNDYSQEGYGIGYSMTAGAYNEFGYMGLLLIMLYGYVFCKIFSNVSPTCAVEKPVQFIVALIFLWFSIRFVRNSLNGLSRGLVYYLFPLIFVSKQIYQKKKHYGKQ